MRPVGDQQVRVERAEEGPWVTGFEHRPVFERLGRALMRQGLMFPRLGGQLIRRNLLDDDRAVRNSSG